MEKIRKHHIFEIVFTTTKKMKGYFFQDDTKKRRMVGGFRKGENETALRFMPNAEGIWNYEIYDQDIKVREGRFLCIEAEENNHGMVKKKGYDFCYEDGVRFLPFGTTCYAWVHQKKDVIEQTLISLSKSPFNKVRMLLFPKDMIYNQNEPEYFPFEKDENGWNVEKPVYAFWENLENCIAGLDSLGIEADLILFHPYDRWGFADLTREQSLAYVEYVMNRLGAYKNIWWSLANEYDLVGSKEQEDWEEIGNFLMGHDPYGHLRSIHHCINIYPKSSWMTHVSAQTPNGEKAFAYRYIYELPVLNDECGYEGNIEFGWGNLSAKEMVHRIWMTVIRGGYATHGETFFREDEVLWWAKGGTLYGESPARIAFFREVLESLNGVLEPEIGFDATDPNGREEAAESPFAKAMMKLPEEQRNDQIMQLLPFVISNENHRLQYLGKACQAWLNMFLPEGDYKIEVIDTWEMTRKTVSECANGNIRIELPGKEGMAVLATRI